MIPVVIVTPCTACRRASSSDENHFGFRSSWRTRLLKGFAKSIVRGASGPREVELDVVSVGPLIEVKRHEFWPIITMDAIGRTALRNCEPKSIGNLRRFEAEIDLESDALATVGIDYCEQSNLGAVFQARIAVSDGDRGELPADRGRPIGLRQIR